MDRNLLLQEKHGFLQMLPQNLYKALVVGYIYDDVFLTFRNFFRPDLYLDTKILEALAFGLKPRLIFGNQDEPSVLYKEGDEFTEMLFIMEGEVGIGYTYFMNN